MEGQKRGAALDLADPGSQRSILLSLSGGMGAAALGGEPPGSLKVEFGSFVFSQCNAVDIPAEVFSGDYSKRPNSSHFSDYSG
jgi:hypothetical protein